MRDVSGYPSTIGRVLTRSATRLPDKLALTFADRRWTYGELDRAAGRVAARLLERGLTPGDRVAAFGRNSDAYLLLYLGCARAGLVHVPVNFNARRDELIYLLAQSEPRAAFVDPSLLPAVAEVAGRLGDTTLGALRDGDTGETSVLSWARDDSGPIHEEHGVDDEDLVQLLTRRARLLRPRGRCSPTGHSSTNTSRRSSPSSSPSATCRCMPCRYITRHRCTPSSCRRSRSARPTT